MFQTLLLHVLFQDAFVVVAKAVVKTRTNASCFRLKSVVQAPKPVDVCIVILIFCLIDIVLDQPTITVMIHLPTVLLCLFCLMLAFNKGHGYCETKDDVGCCTGDITIDPSLTAIADSAFYACSGLSYYHYHCYHHHQ
jgi:hypothetical protein